MSVTLKNVRDRATISVEEMSELLGISRPTAYKAARSGDIPMIRVAGRILVPVAPLLRMLGDQPEADVR